MEVFKNFGFEPVFFVAQIINFLILAFVFKRYLYKPILKVLKDRQHKIAQGVKDAENAKIALEEASSRKDDIIKEATLEAEKIIEETRISAEQLRQELAGKSKEEAEKIINEAKILAELELKRAESKAKDISLDISRKVLGKVLDEIFTKQEREKIVERNIKRLGRYE